VFFGLDFGYNDPSALVKIIVKGDDVWEEELLYESGLNNQQLVNKLKDNFMKAFNNKVKIGIMHGKMKKTDKDQVMQEYKDGKIKILISTTVIEVGVDVKDATVMIIYNAERFGLATLHQLRGRVGRNDVQSYCYLISNEDVPRLKVLEESNDGFYISEKDFEMRGEGAWVCKCRGQGAVRRRTAAKRASKGTRWTVAVGDGREERAAQRR
jgi:RecG-like helicase